MRLLQILANFLSALVLNWASNHLPFEWWRLLLIAWLVVLCLQIVFSALRQNL
jgi:hypothetical protein